MTEPHEMLTAAAKAIAMTHVKNNASYQDMARAALLAIRDLTPDVLQVGREQACDQWTSPDPSECWGPMLDVILGERRAVDRINVK